MRANKIVSVLVSCMLVLHDLTGLGQLALAQGTDAPPGQPITLYEFDWNETDQRFDFTFDLNAVPRSGDKVYEGQVCESKALPNVNFTCMDEKEHSGNNINRHTRGFFVDVMADASYKSQLNCERLNAPSRLVKPCMGDQNGQFRAGEVALSCYADWDCCSGYCEPESALAFDYRSQVNIDKGKKGNCKARPNNYIAKWPLAPSGKLAGVTCAADAECQSKNCKEGSCTAANVCKRCTPVGKRATFGAPCCGEASVTLNDNICVAIDANFLPSSIEEIMGKTSAAQNKIDQLVDQDILDGLTINVPERGNCSFQYIYGGQNVTAMQGGGSSLSEGPGDPAAILNANIDIEKKVKALLYLKESIISVYEFLELYKSSNGPKEADDVFGIHARLKEALRPISQMRYDVHFIQKRFEKERDAKLAAIKAKFASVGSLGSGGTELSEAQRLFLDSIAAEQAGESGAGNTAALQVEAMNFEVEALRKMKEVLNLQKTTMFSSYVKLMDGYEKKSKDRGSNMPSVPKFGLMTWLKGNRQAGVSQIDAPWTMGASIADDTTFAKKQWGQQEELSEGFDEEEGEENRESCYIQHDVIFRTSTNCDYTENQEEVVEDTEEYEEEEDGFDSLSRYCVGNNGGSKNLGHGYSLEAKGKDYTYIHEFWSEFLADLRLPWFLQWLSGSQLQAAFDNIPLTYVTSYPAFIFDDNGNRVSSTNLSQNIRTNFRNYVEDPVKHTWNITLNSGSEFNANENIFGAEYKVLLNILAQDDMAILDSSAWLSSVTFTKMQPAHYQPHLILFLSNLVYQLATAYEKLEAAYTKAEACMAANAAEIAEQYNPGGSSDPGTFTQGNSQAVAGGLSTPTMAGTGPGATGSGFGNNTFGPTGSLGNLGAGFGSGGGVFTDLAGINQRNLAADLHAMSDSMIAQAKASKERFFKNFGNSALGKRHRALEKGLNKSLNSIVNSAKRATVKAMQAKSGGSAANNLQAIAAPTDKNGAGSGAGGSGSGDSSDEERLKRLRANMNGGGEGGSEGGGYGGEGYSNGGGGGGTFGGNGTVDAMGLVDAAKREKASFQNQEDDTLFKIISNRYMKSLDRILIKKKE